MRAWVVGQPGPLESGPLVPVELPDPVPGPGEVRIRVRACGVCRTDLHLVLGELPPRWPHTVPGHEIVGVVDATGPNPGRFRIGDRIGVAWLQGSCGHCRFCRTGREKPVRDRRLHRVGLRRRLRRVGGRAGEYAYRLPDELDEVVAAPLLCAGIVGCRALRRARLPAGGRLLGLYGFGASAQVIAQVAIAQGAEVHVLTRSPEA
jgi:alcohol dehydrogenase, propanol-preferring